MLGGRGRRWDGGTKRRQRRRKNEEEKYTIERGGGRVPEGGVGERKRAVEEKEKEKGGRRGRERGRRSTDLRVNRGIRPHTWLLPLRHPFHHRRTTPLVNHTTTRPCERRGTRTCPLRLPCRSHILPIKGHHVRGVLRDRGIFSTNSPDRVDSRRSYVG